MGDGRELSRVGSGNGEGTGFSILLGVLLRGVRLRTALGDVARKRLLASSFRNWRGLLKWLVMVAFDNLGGVVRSLRSVFGLGGETSSAWPLCLSDVRWLVLVGYRCGTSPGLEGVGEGELGRRSNGKERLRLWIASSESLLEGDCVTGVEPPRARTLRFMDRATDGVSSMSFLLLLLLLPVLLLLLFPRLSCLLRDNESARRSVDGEDEEDFDPGERRMDSDGVKRRSRWTWGDLGVRGVRGVSGAG